MKQRRSFDLVIIGADAPGLAAAACAARQHAQISLRVAVVRTGEETPLGASFPGVPDFVWRRLDLQDSALAAKPVEALVSVFAGGRTLALYQDRQRTSEALEEAGADQYHLWADVSRALERDWGAAEALLQDSAKGKPAFLRELAGRKGAKIGRRLAASCAEMLDDLFANEELKTHLASVALMPLGLAGDEPGTGLALAAAMEKGAWRMTAGEDSASLLKALEEACAAAGVELVDGAVLDVQMLDDKNRLVLLGNGDSLKAPLVMAGRAASATAARLGAAPAFSPLGRREGATAEVRVKLAKAAEPPGEHGDKAVYFFAGSRAALKGARDAAEEGRIPDEPPIFFEFSKDEILVTAPYCPSALYTEDERRDWSEQDRQALGRRIVERLGAAMNGAIRGVKRIEVKIAARGPEEEAAVAAARIIAPPASHDEIGAAARLAMELVRGG